MKYDFTSIMNRHGKDAIAVDSVGQMNGFAPEAPKPGFDVIPMWVADMNFPTVPTIQQAIIERAQHPAFGYFSATDEYYDSIIRWHQTRNGVIGLTKECIGYENGVLGGVISALTSFAAPGDAVLLHSPTYIGFTASVENNGYKIVHSPLVKDENGVWRMDFEDMDAKIKANHIHVAIFCSPHNPCGRVWERWELEKAMEVYRANDCLVISDEIWSDIILNGHKHIPTQSVSEDARSRTVALYAPSKTFNLAGLVGSYHIIYNPYLRDRVRAKSSKPHYNDMNVLSMHALIGAYKPEGYDGWRNCGRPSAAMSTLPVIISPSILKAFRSASRRAPTCSSWIARIGAKPTGKPLPRWKKPAGMWALPGRMAVCSTAPAPSA